MSESEGITPNITLKPQNIKTNLLHRRQLLYTKQKNTVSTDLSAFSISNPVSGRPDRNEEESRTRHENVGRTVGEGKKLRDNQKGLQNKQNQNPKHNQNMDASFRSRDTVMNSLALSRVCMH